MSLVVLCALIVSVVPGCGVGVSAELGATVTPYPVRSPVAPSPGDRSVVGSSATLVSQGRALLAAGDWVGAERAFDRSFLREQGNVGAIAGRAEARLARGDLNGAVADLAALLALELSDATDRRVRGELRVRFGDTVGAQQDFSESVARDPSDAAALIGRRLALVEPAAGRRAAYDLALADFSRALAIDPDLSLAKLGSIVVLADRAEFGGDPIDWQRAADQISALGTMVPSHHPCRAALATRVWLALDRLSEGREALDSAMATGRVGPDLACLHAGVAAVRLAEGDVAGAELSAAAAIAADPLNWNARRMSVVVGLDRGDCGTARLEADRLLRLLPGDRKTLYAKGLALAGAERGTEAREVLAEAGSVMEASPVYRAKVAVAIKALTST